MAQYQSINNVEQQQPPPAYPEHENQTQIKRTTFAPIIDFIERQSVFIYYFNWLVIRQMLPSTTIKNIYIKYILLVLIVLIDYSLFFGLITINCLSIYYGAIYNDC